MVLKVKLLDPKAKIPIRATPDAVGYDICNLEAIVFSKNNASKIVFVSTGVAIELPKHPDPTKKYEIQVRPRSGLASKGFTVVNSPGTIDPDYRGEIKVLMSYNNTQDYYLQPGTRIAQLVINEVYIPIVTIVDELTETERGDGGFGHTGYTSL